MEFRITVGLRSRRLAECAAEIPDNEQTTITAARKERAILPRAAMGPDRLAIWVLARLMGSGAMHNSQALPPAILFRISCMTSFAFPRLNCTVTWIPLCGSAPWQNWR